MDKVIVIIEKSLSNGDVIDTVSLLKELYVEVKDFDELMFILRTSIIKDKLLLDIILEKEQKFYFEIISLKMFPECIHRIYNSEVLNNVKFRKKYLDDNFADDFIDHLLNYVK